MLDQVHRDFDFRIVIEALAAKCRAKVGTEQYDRLLWLYEMAYEVGRPKALVVEKAVGVCLTDSCLMLPSKSVSGILFQDHTGHVNCALCPREKCPNRRVSFRTNVK